MRLSDILRFFVLPVYRPVGGLRELLQSERKLGVSAVVFLFLGLIYTASVQLAYSRGLGAAVEPFLRISAEEYYRWQRFYQIPFFFLTSIVFAGAARLLSATVRGAGQFEDIFAVFCVAQTFPMFLTMWLPETAIFLFSPHNDPFPLWIHTARQIVGIAWPVALTVVGITLAERVRWLHALWISLIAAVPAVALMVVFIR
jgi:hypothetical protein